MFKELFTESFSDENFDEMLKQLKKDFGIKSSKETTNKNGATLLVSIKDYDSADFEKFKKYWEPDYHIGLSTSNGTTVSAYLKD